MLLWPVLARARRCSAPRPRGDSARAAGDSAGAKPRSTVAAASPLRASWLSDRQPIRVGDLLTIVVDEQTSASEQMSTIATGNRSQRASLGIGVDSAVRLGPRKQFSGGIEASSSDVGEASPAGRSRCGAGRAGIGIDAAGNAKIEGDKNVSWTGGPRK